MFFNHNRSLSTGLKKICSIKNVLFCFLITTNFACLQTVFNYSEVSLCFSYFFFMWGQFDIYWYILEAGDLCPFMPIFIVREWGLYPTLAFHGGWTGGPFSLLLPLFSFLTPLFALLPPLVSFLPPLLFSFLPATFSFLPPPLSFIPPPFSHLLSPLLPQPCPPLHSCKKKSICALLVLRSLNHSVEKTNCMRCRVTIKPLFCDITNSIL